MIGGRGPEPPNDGGRGPEPPNDGGRGAEPPNDGGRGAEPPNDGGRGAEPPNDGGRGPEPPNDGGRGAEPPDYGELAWFRGEVVRSLLRPREFARALAHEHFGLAGVLVALFAGMALSITIDVFVLAWKGI